MPLISLRAQRLLPSHPKNPALTGAPGQSHLNSDATIAHEGHPQGVPLPIVFSRRFGLGRAPTRGAPTDCLLSAFWPGKGTHKGCPYRLSSLGVLAWEGHPQGVPLPIVLSRRFGLERAPTRGAPTDCLLSAFWPGKGTHKGRPYRLSSLGVLAWEGHPQGAPLPIVFSRRFGLAKGTHKGCPYRLSSLGVLACEGRPQGVPLPIVSLGFSPLPRFGLGRAPTRGAPTDCLLRLAWKGTHKGCPPIVFSRRFGLGRAPTRGAPTDCLLSVLAWEGHPQGLGVWACPTRGAPDVFSRRFGLGRAPTRGAPTDCLLSAFWPEKGAHKGRPYPIHAAHVGLAHRDLPCRGPPRLDAWRDNLS